MKTLASLLLLLGCLSVSAQKAVDPFSSLAFLQATWDAHGEGQGATTFGTYTFGLELGGHILARHGTDATCKGPQTIDCRHGDLLYVYPEGPGLKAIYFDNEGHVLHYDVSKPDPYTVMSGKFQMHMPGQTDWRSYLSWSGGKK